MNYQFIDAYGSVITAASDLQGGVNYPIIEITGSVITTAGATANQSVSGTVNIGNLPTNQSVSGTVGVSVIGYAPVVIIGGSVAATFTPPANQSVSGAINIVGNPSISGQVGASIIGLTPVNISNTNLNVSGSVISFPSSTTPGSVVAFISGTPNVNTAGSVAAFIQGTPNVNTAGSVVAFQGTSPWVVQSIVGTFAEDGAHTNADKGLFILGVRNDTVASLTSADLDYSPKAVDAIGRTIVKPFAGEDATIISYNGSVVSGSVTLIQASVAGKRNYITDFWASNSGSVFTLLTFQGGDTSIVGFAPVPATGGISSPGIAIPLKTTSAQDLAFKVGTSTSVVYLTVKGYQAQ